MAIKFTVREVTNKLTTKSPKLAYAVHVPTARAEVKEVAHLISERSALSSADVKSALDNFAWVLAHHLSMGVPVSAGDLGSFSIRLRSKSVAEKKDFSAHNIRRMTIVYSPGERVRQMLRELKFVHVSDETMQKGGSTPDRGESGGGTVPGGGSSNLD